MSLSKDRFSRRSLQQPPQRLRSDQLPLQRLGRQQGDKLDDAWLLSWRDLLGDR